MHSATAVFDNKTITVITGRGATAGEVTAAISGANLNAGGVSGNLSVSAPDQFNRHTYTITKTYPNTTIYGTWHTNIKFRQYKDSYS